MGELPADLPQQVAAALRGRHQPCCHIAAAEVLAQRVRGSVVVRELAVLCGRAWVAETFRQLDSSVQLTWHAADGDRVAAQQVIFAIAGPARAVLSGERTALNFLQLLSGTATATRRFVDAVAGTSCRILDTRKTVPGLRTAQKYAVRCGGAQNHRMGLYDQVLIKENHIAAAGSLTGAIEAARRNAAGITVEVEVETPGELEEALNARPDLIMLDEFTLEDMRAAVALNRARGAVVKLEVSGSVSLEAVRAIAETGVDYISVGALTKHVRAIDLSMRLDFGGG